MKIDLNKVADLMSGNKVNKLSASFTGLTSDTRQILLNAFGQNDTISDKELLIMFNDTLSVSNEIDALKAERAKLSIDKLISDGLLDYGVRELYIKLATNNYEVVIDLITCQHTGKIELDSILKLSNHELYMSDGKLERLMELSPPIFKQKHMEIFGVEFKN